MINKIHNFWIQKIKPLIIRFLSFISKGEKMYLLIAAFIAIGFITWAIATKKDVTDVIELSAFSAVVLEGILVSIVSVIKKVISNHTEDPNKLTTDYQKLLKRYSSEKNFVWSRTSDGISVIPVVHEIWLFDKELEINDHPESEYNLPDIIDKHYEELFLSHLTSKVYNNINIRVDDWQLSKDNKRFIVNTGRTSYYSSLVTNRAMDYQLDKGISVRELLECGPKIHPLKYSLLSNHLGFNGFIETCDGYIMLVFRKKNVSIGKHTYANSIGASLKTKYALNDDFILTKDGLINGIFSEIDDELGISKENITKIQLVSAYRDMLEGGKPQLLFFAETSMEMAKIDEIFKRKSNQSTKFTRNFDRETNEKEMETDGDELYWIPTSEIVNCEVCSTHISHNGLNLPMLPSAAACVVMLKQFIKSSFGAKTIAEYSLPVAESYICGKIDDSTCEDKVFLGDRFVAVIDGVTSKGDYLYNNMTAGKYASEVLCNKLLFIDRTMRQKSISPEEILFMLDQSLTDSMKNFDEEKIGTVNRLRASIIIFDRKEKLVINYGDCMCKIDDKCHMHKKKIDAELAEKRALVLSAAISNGATVSELLSNDIGRKAIMPDLIEQFEYENIDGEYGYPVLNGNGIKEKMIKKYSVSEGQTVILCSDGYPYICDSLDESELRLSVLLENDPLLIKEFKSTKGIQHGTNSFDDRAWVKIG